MNAFVSTLNDESVAYRCLSLIERHCPRLMRAGGGPLEQDNPNYHTPVSLVERTEIRRMLNDGKTVPEMCRALNRSQNAVNCAIRKMGLKTPRQLQLARERLRVARLLRRGFSIRVTAGKTGVPYYRVWTIRRQLNAA